MGTQIIDRIDKAVKNADIRRIVNNDFWQLHTDGFLSSLMITNIKRVGISEITQLQKLKEQDYDKALEKLKEADQIGTGYAKAILSLIDLYYEENINVETKQVEDVVDAVEEAEEKPQSPLAVNGLVEIVEQHEDYEDAEGNIIVDKFKDGLVDENELGNILLNTALDCAQEENIGFIRYDEDDKPKRIGGYNVIFNMKVLLIEPEFIKKRFDKYIADNKLRLIGEHERDIYMYFRIALASIEDVIKLSWKNGTKFYFSRKEYTGNRLNYIQFDIEKLEERTNRKLKLCDQIKKKIKNGIVTESMLGGSIVMVNKKIPVNVPDASKPTINQPTETKTTTTIKKEEINMKKPNNQTKASVSNIVIEPRRCEEYVAGTGVYIAAFEVLESSNTEIKDKFNFNTSSGGKTDQKSKGVVFYVFEKDQPKNGRYSIAPDLQEYFDVIKFGINSFFNGQ